MKVSRHQRISILFDMSLEEVPDASTTLAHPQRAMSSLGKCVQVKRGGKTIIRKELVSLRRAKDDVKQVLAGSECGLKLHFHEM